MKKCLKNILGITIFSLGFMAVVNKVIDILCTKHYSSSEKEETYEWRFGDVKYIKKGKGAPILLVHALDAGFSRREWDRVINSLAEKYTVYALNLLGWGSSDKPDLTYNAYSSASLINDFIADVIGKKAAVCASAGSASALLMAYITIPKNFSRIVLVSPEMSGKGAVCCHGLKRFIISRPVVGTFIYNLYTLPCAIRNNIKNGYYNRDKAAMENTDAMYIAEHMNGGGKYAFACSLAGFTIVDVRHLLADVKVPLYIITGEDAELDGTVDELEEIRPDAKFYIFEDVGRFPHRENPTEFARIVKEI